MVAMQFGACAMTMMSTLSNPDMKIGSEILAMDIYYNDFFPSKVVLYTIDSL